MAIVGLALLARWFCAEAHASVSFPALDIWIGEASAQVVQYQQNPLRAARALALVSVAANDAYQFAVEGGYAPSVAAAAGHVAAGGALEYLYPQSSPGRFAAQALYSVQLEIPSFQPIDSTAWKIGTTVARVAAARAVDDGADRVWSQRVRPKPEPGLWRAAPPLQMHSPIEPLAGSWRPWTLESVEDIVVPPPPAFGSDSYLQEVREVLEVSRSLTTRQKQLADEWHLDKGSVTPAGVWNKKATTLIRHQDLDPGQAATLLAALNVAMADALIAAWHVKYKYWTLRPVNAVRDTFDADWLPYLITPPFPSYVSGHASMSGAAAEVIACLLPHEANNARAMAREAAMSRLYGGIHLRSDNDEGLKLGIAIGRKVCAKVAEHNGRVRWLDLHEAALHGVLSAPD